MKRPVAWKCYVCDIEIKGNGPYICLSYYESYPGDPTDTFYTIHFDCFKNAAGEEFTDYFELTKIVNEIFPGK